MSTDVSSHTRRPNRLFAGLLIAGAALGAVVNALHPINTGGIEETLAHIADSGVWMILHLGIMIAILLLAVGLVGFADSLEGTPGATLARVATILTLIGGTLAMVNFAIDGFTVKYLADSWAEASSSDTATWLGLFTAVKQVNAATWGTTVLVLFGLSVGAHGLASRRSAILPAWVAWGALASGAGSIVAALIHLPAAGESRAADFTFFGSTILLTLWAFVVGYQWWRGRLRTADATLLS